jgi:hypothetical protein
MSEDPPLALTQRARVATRSTWCALTVNPGSCVNAKALTCDGGVGIGGASDTFHGEPMPRNQRQRRCAPARPPFRPHCQPAQHGAGVTTTAFRGLTPRGQALGSDRATFFSVHRSPSGCPSTGAVHGAGCNGGTRIDRTDLAGRQHSPGRPRHRHAAVIPAEAETRLRAQVLRGVPAVSTTGGPQRGSTAPIPPEQREPTRTLQRMASALGRRAAFFFPRSPS